MKKTDPTSNAGAPKEKKKLFRWNMQKSLFLFISLMMLASGIITGIISYVIYTLFPQINTSSNRWDIFLVLLFSVLLGTLLSFAFSRLWLHTAKDLSDAAQEVSRGNFHVQVEEKGQRGEFLEMVRSFNNMTRELSHTEIFRNDFINYFSHEFKTPIVSISGFAKRLKDETIDEKEKQEYIRIIIEECDRLTRLATNILLLSQFENREIISSVTTFAVDEQIRHCLVMLEKDWSAKDLELDIEMDEIYISTNEEMLALVWTNLLSNAIKFSHRGGALHITCDEMEDKLHVVVADDGIGMSDETRSHIFEKFYQGDTSHKSAGNGLGLALVKRIVTLCRGEIIVSSKEGHGTSFTVILPKNPHY